MTCKRENIQANSIKIKGQQRGVTKLEFPEAPLVKAVQQDSLVGHAVPSSLVYSSSVASWKLREVVVAGLSGKRLSL